MDDFRRLARACLLPVALLLASGGMVPQAVAAQDPAIAANPALMRPYTALTLQPLRELLDYLEPNGFATWIVSAVASSSCARSRRRSMASRPSA